MSRERFWDQVKEIAPPPCVDYVIHTINSRVSKNVGMSAENMAEMIQSIGLFVPVNYSMLTLKFDRDWVTDDAGKIVDLVFLTETKPTSEDEGVIRDSASYGFPLRDPVGEVLEAEKVPQLIKNIFPDRERFFRVPPEHLKAIAVWDREERFEISKQVCRVALAVANGTTIQGVGTEEIMWLLSNAPFLFVNGAGRSSLLSGIATGCIEAEVRRQKYLRMLEDFVK